MVVEKKTPETEDILEEEIVEDSPSGPLDVQFETEQVEEEAPKDDFSANLAENMDDRTLSSMAGDLIQEYK